MTVNVLHDIGTAQVPLPAKNVRLSALPTLSAQLIALLAPLLADVRVPLVGVGASGDVTGLGAIEIELRVGSFLVASFLLDDLAATLNVANEIATVQNRTAIKLRELIKPDLEEDCFFILVLFGGWIGVALMALSSIRSQ